MDNKRGQSQTGLVLGLVSGVAFLIIGIIIAFVVVGTLEGSNLIPQTTYTRYNESQATNGGSIVFANTTGYTLNGTRYAHPNSYVITAVWADWNQSNGTNSAIVNTSTGYNVSLAASNYSLNTNSSGNLSSGLPGTYNFPNVSVSYYFKADNAQNLAASNLTSNFSSGVQNVSGKIPTILLIGAIILILGIVAVLIVLWQRLRMGQGGAL